jgi:hypothetical protein
MKKANMEDFSYQQVMRKEEYNTISHDNA